MLNAILKCHMAGPNALSMRPLLIYIYIYICWYWLMISLWEKCSLVLEWFIWVASCNVLRLHLFWLKRISGNHFTLAYMFGNNKKLGQTEINFRVDCKITLLSWKWISVSILPSNDFHPRKIKERERNNKKRLH